MEECYFCKRVLPAADEWDCDSVQWTYDPFVYDVYEEIEEMWICGSCECDRRDEV